MKKLSATIFILSCAHILSAQPCTPNTNSLSFNGTSAYVSTASQTGLDITDSITVEAWVFPTQFGITSAQNSIVCKHGWSQGEAGYVLRLGGTGELSFNLAGLDTNGLPVSWVDNISAASALTLNAWNHVAGTFDGLNSITYINGIAIDTVAFKGTIVSAPSYNVTLGRLSDPGQPAGRYFAGIMDEVRIWHRALSQTEIQSQMNDHINPATATGLVSYWRMNNGTGTTITDLAGANPGTTNNTTWSAIVPFNSTPPTPAIVYNGTLLVSNAPSNNQWYLNGVLIAGATQFTYAPVQNGTYTVVVTNASGCSATSNGYIITTVGINDVANNLFAAIYPNPAKDFVVVEITDSNPENVLIRITDLIGKTIIEEKLKTNKIQIDVENLTSGIYIIELTKDRQKHCCRFVKF
jgi:Concanavalin A-like lectin/glucanases superfamily/Secretion system C-terminal sorting domain